MTEKITQLETQLLLGAVADMESLRRGRPIPGVNGWRALEDAKADAADGLVRLATARWLGHQTLPPAARMAVTRAFVRLERRGLAKRSAEHWAEERANCLRVTDAGRKLAKELRTAEAPTDA